MMRLAPVFAGLLVDVEVIASAVWSMGGKTELNRRQLAVPLAREPNAEAAVLPANAAVKDLVRLVEARDAKPFRLVLK
jgi:hypothetical protein